MFIAPRLPHPLLSVARSPDSRSLSSVAPSPGSSAPPPGPSPSAALCSRRSVCPCAGQSTGARSARELLPQQPRAQHILVPHLVQAQAHMQAPQQVQVPPTQAPAFQVPHHPPYPPPQVILVQVLVSLRQASRLMLPVQLPVPPQCQRPIITALPCPLGLVIVHLPPPPPQASPPLPYPLQITTIMALP